MEENQPFLYEVRFNLIAHDENNNFEIYSYQKKYSNNDPIKARIEAFEAFHEYLNYTDKQIIKDERGNLWIETPLFIGEIARNAANQWHGETDRSELYHLIRSKEITKEEFNKRKKELTKKWKEEVGKFRQEISVVLVLNNNEKQNNPNFPAYQGLLEFGGYRNTAEETEFIIHQIASYDVDEQAMVDSLDYELKLYHFYGFDVGDYERTVEHYGYSYAMEEDENEDYGLIPGNPTREILQTPHIWKTLEQYEEEESRHGPPAVNKEESVIAKENGNLDYEAIIKKGEGNQVEFKPALLFNVKTKKACENVKYKIARNICSFLNSNGGLLFIGVNDNGEVHGMERLDYTLFEKNNARDKVNLALDSLISIFFGVSIGALIYPKIESINGNDVLIIHVSPSAEPVFLRNKRNGRSSKEFIIRLSGGSHQIKDVEDIIKYAKLNWWNTNGI